LNVISKRGLLSLIRGKGSEVADDVMAWFKAATGADWANLDDVRESFPDADQVGEVLVFNIRHNRYRLIATVFYPARTIYLKALLKHKEYDRKEWKKWA
jgi:mRNA interferase HigB